MHEHFVSGREEIVTANDELAVEQNHSRAGDHKSAAEEHQQQLSDHLEPQFVAYEPSSSSTIHDFVRVEEQHELIAVTNEQPFGLHESGAKHHESPLEHQDQTIDHERLHFDKQENSPVRPTSATEDQVFESAQYSTQQHEPGPQHNDKAIEHDNSVMCPAVDEKHQVSPSEVDDVRIPQEYHAYQQSNATGKMRLIGLNWILCIDTSSILKLFVNKFNGFH